MNRFVYYEKLIHIHIKFNNFLIEIYYYKINKHY